MESVFYGLETQNIMTIEQAMAKLQYLSYNVTLESGEQMIILEKDDVFEVLDKVVKNCSIPAVVGRSEQLTCPRCKSINCLTPDKENDAKCNDCGFIWAG